MYGYNLYQQPLLPPNYSYGTQQQPAVLHQNQQPIGRWQTVDSYQAVQSMPVPADGTPTIFMLSDQPIFYVVSMANGQKFINAYKFFAMNSNEEASEQKQQQAQSPLETRVAKLENIIAAMGAGGQKNESDCSTAKGTTTAAKQP
jgi:hypothetical protein